MSEHHRFRLTARQLDWLREHGLDHEWGAARVDGSGAIIPNTGVALSTQLAFEPPCRPLRTELLDDVRIGAFTYMVAGRVQNAHIGRYCSLATDISIGLGDHPIDWLSTHPFQFKNSFRFRVGHSFPEAEQYHSHRIDKQNRRSSEVLITRIGHDVWIANGAFIRTGITIGDGAIVAARSVVTKDVPPYAIVGGNPASVIRYRFPEAIIERLLALQWWRFAPWDMNGIQYHDIEACLDTLEKRIQSDEIQPYAPPWVSAQSLTDIA